ncbi:MAG: hypothetical protein P0S95_01280 [Rhabdochlamydiaceae bacterium]|nr:hypothetical protein [Candidatus Amphrikana amoebophyrae]
MNDELLQIKLQFESPPEVQEGLEFFVKSLESSLRLMIPKSVLEKAPDPNDKDATRAFFGKIGTELPLIYTSFGKTAPYIISMKFLAFSELTHGMGRFVSDVVSRWLVPGKQLPLLSVNSMAFEFVRYPGIGFFFHELFLKAENENDFNAIKNNLDNLMDQIKLNILSVTHARKIVAQKNLTLDQKKMIIQENIASLLGKPKQVHDETIFDQSHQFLVKILAEKQVSSIKEQIAPLLELRPQIFERDVFNELHEGLLLLKESFIAYRDSKHLTRIIAYIYLFRKTVANSAILHPNQRHLSLKVLKTKIKDNNNIHPVLGLVISLNILRENEIFEERHLAKAINAILPFARKVQDSYFESRRADSVRNFYIEIEKIDSTPFTSLEIAMIKQKLPTEVKTRIETVINPIFIQKNEEEVMRNILVLSNQLKYVHDIPQLIISFLKQTDNSLSFIVVMARLLRGNDRPLKFLLSNCPEGIRIENHEVRSMGLLRKKYPKEANVFEVHIEKQRFLREDFSLDLYEARRVVYDSLSSVLGDIRDYNGGMISKQNEALGELTKLLLEEDISNNFLIENYFYSLKPIYMQSVLPPIILKKQFMMLIQLTEHDYSQQPYFMQMQIVDNYFILMLGSMSPSFKDIIFNSIENCGINSNDLTSSLLNNHDVLCLGYLYQFTNPKDYETLLISVTEGIKNWQKSIQSPQKFDPVTLHLKQTQRL